MGHIMWITFCGSQYVYGTPFWRSYSMGYNLWVTICGSQCYRYHLICHILWVTIIGHKLWSQYVGNNQCITICGSQSAGHNPRVTICGLQSVTCHLRKYYKVQTKICYNLHQKLIGTVLQKLLYNERILTALTKPFYCRLFQYGLIREILAVQSILLPRF